MAFNPQDYDVKPIGAAGLEERISLDGSERILVQAGADADVNTTPMQFFKYQVIKSKIDEIKGTDWEDQTVKGNADAIDTLKGTNWAGQTVKGNADAIALRELLSNKKTTLTENSDVFFPTQQAVNKGLATKTSKSQIAYDNDNTSFIANTLASGAIIERGSNANGEYVKFADGTMLCRHTISLIDYAMTSQFGSIYYKSGGTQWVFPTAFIAPPAISSATHNSEAYITFIGTGQLTGTSAHIYPLRPNSTTLSFDLIVTVIGRWK